MTSFLLLLANAALRPARRAVVAGSVAVAVTAGAGAQPPATEAELAETQPAVVETQLRAAFLLNLARFVEWPPWAFVSATDPISICLVGGDPFGRALDDVVRGKVVAGRRVLVVRGAKVESAACHIIFVPAGSARRLADLLYGRTRAPSLTVSDAPFFADDGGMIGVYTEARRVRFEINVAAAEANGLRVSSRLVSLASRVTSVDGDHQ